MAKTVNACESFLTLLVDYANQFRPDNPFQLTSGGTSPEYLDGKQSKLVFERANELRSSTTWSPLAFLRYQR
jgi:hypothetical protein